MPLKSYKGLAERLAELGTQAFGSADYYSQPENIEKFLTKPNTLCLLRKQDSKIIGYYLLRFGLKQLHGERLAVERRHRNKKIGTKLIRGALGVARKKRKSFTTYTRRDNLGSFNLHMRCGMKLTKIDDNYLYLSTD